jgi:hypothetical protein
LRWREDCERMRFGSDLRAGEGLGRRLHRCADAEAAVAFAREVSLDAIV